MAGRSTPVTGWSRGRAAHVTAWSWRRRPRRRGASGGPAGPAIPCRGAAMTRAQPRICSWSSSSNARDGWQAHRGSGCHVPCSARAIVSARALQRGSRRVAHAWGARAPGTMARTRRRPGRPVRSLPPAGRVTCLCSSACARRCTCRPASARRVARGRCDARHTRGGAAGRQAGQPPAAREPREPLTGVDGGLGARGGALPLAGIAPQPLAAGALQQGVERQPVHARRCPGPRRPLARPHPGSHGGPGGRAGPAAAAVGGARPRARSGPRGTRPRSGAPRPLTRWPRYRCPRRAG